MYSACIRILSVPSFVSILSIRPIYVCLSNSLSYRSVRVDYKIRFSSRHNPMLPSHYIKSTFYAYSTTGCYKPLKGHIFTFIVQTPPNVSYLLSLPCHFPPLVSVLSLSAPSSIIVLCLPAQFSKGQ